MASILSERADTAKRPALVVGALAGLAWLARYALSFGLPIAHPPKWILWNDQARYLASAVAFAHGSLASGAHWYPLAYPLVAAPFVWLLPHDPFLVPDLCAFVATALAFERFAGRIGIGRWWALAVFLLADLSAGRWPKLWIEPWTTTLGAPLIWWLLVLVLDLAERADETPDAAERTDRRRWILCGMLAGALPLVRPLDVLVSALALLFLAAARMRRGRLHARHAAWIMAGACVPIIPYALLHLAIYGPHLTPYMLASAGQGFTFGDLPWKAYTLLVTPAPWYPNSQSWIEGMPWILPGAAGLLGLGWSGPIAARRAVRLAGLLAIPYLLVFLAYSDLQPTGLWGFNNIHYFKWLFPLLGAGLFGWVRRFRTVRGAIGSIGLLLLLILPACLRLLPVPVDDATPARMLTFRGDTRRDWNEAYFSNARVTDDRGWMGNIWHYRQVPDAAGVRAIAITRPFGRHPLWTDPGEPAPPRAPSGRFAEHLSIGLPCWFARAACRIEGLAPDRPD